LNFAIAYYLFLVCFLLGMTVA